MEISHGKTEINQIIKKIVALYDHISNFDETHEKALRDLVLKYDYKNIFNKNLMLSEFHVIDCIGKNQLPNTTFISKELGMTKGAISKITSKLLKKDLIKANRLENNKKEIYYTLTTQGKQAFKIHEELHEIENQKIIAVLNRYSKNKLDTINNFLDDLINEL